MTLEVLTEEYLQKVKRRRDIFTEIQERGEALGIPFEKANWDDAVKFAFSVEFDCDHYAKGSLKVDVDDELQKVEIKMGYEEYLGSEEDDTTNPLDSENIDERLEANQELLAGLKDFSENYASLREAVDQVREAQQLNLVESCHIDPLLNKYKEVEDRVRSLQNKAAEARIEEELQKARAERTTLYESFEDLNSRLVREKQFEAAEQHPLSQENRSYGAINYIGEDNIGDFEYTLEFNTYAKSIELLIEESGFKLETLPPEQLKDLAKGLEEELAHVQDLTNKLHNLAQDFGYTLKAPFPYKAPENQLGFSMNIEGKPKPQGNTPEEKFAAYKAEVAELSTNPISPPPTKEVSLGDDDIPF